MGGRLLPIEIKATGRPRLGDATHLRTFRGEYPSDRRSVMMEPQASLGITGGAVALPLLLWVLWRAHKELGGPGFWQSVLVAGAGVAAGWLAGFLASPHPEEKATFAEYAGLIGAFFSGYLLSKLEPSVAEVFGEGNLVKKPVYGIRAIAFVVGFVVGAITMFVFRSYLFVPSGAK